MQKLERRNTYTPTDIPHIRSNCGLALNREETLSVSGLKTLFNNSDAALTATGRAGQDLRVPAVYVLKMRVNRHYSIFIVLALIIIYSIPAQGYINESNTTNTFNNASINLMQNYSHGFTNSENIYFDNQTGKWIISQPEFNPETDELYLDNNTGKWVWIHQYSYGDALKNPSIIIGIVMAAILGNKGTKIIIKKLKKKGTLSNTEKQEE